MGLGAGWTGDQLRKQRDLRRTIEELDVDKERRQQELDQVTLEKRESMVDKRVHVECFVHLKTMMIQMPPTALSRTPTSKD